MMGPAGVGKSAIAQTCAEKLKETGHLGAAFFFTVKGHNNSLRLFTTIAYQLSTTLPDYRALVDERISKDKTLVEKKISSQFKSLIIEPLRELESQGKRMQPKAIFIDGLDECAGEDAQAEIIKMIASSVRDGSTPFRWAIFSCAEPRIVSTFKQDNVASVTHSVELPISRDADGEIEMYLRENSRVFSNTEIMRTCRRHGQPTTILKSLLMQQMACLLILLLSCVMLPIHATVNSVKDSNLSWMPYLNQATMHLHHPFPNLMHSMSTS